MRYSNLRKIHLLALSMFALIATSCGILTDQGFIVFVTGNEGDRDIAVIRPDGTDYQLIIGHEADDFAPVWSSDGRRLAYLSNRDGNVEVYVTLVIDSKGGFSQELSDHLGLSKQIGASLVVRARNFYFSAAAAANLTVT